MSRFGDPGTMALRLLAPVAAVGFSAVIAAIVLSISGNDPLNAFSLMLEFGTRQESIISTINRAVPLYLSGVAVAIGFKMGLFNIGVEGQYTLAVLVAAGLGTAVSLPAPLHVLFIVIVAMLVGSAWAGVAGVLKVTRGVHEVISTIMLNVIAGGLVAYMLRNYFIDKADTTLNLQTEKLPASGQFPSLNSVLESIGIESRPGSDLEGFVLIALICGLAYYLLVWRTRFGFDLRATGINPLAAQASGVRPAGMTLQAMLLSGAVAGLVGLPTLLGFSYNYNLDFPTGLGFAGITAALLGRNHPIGIAVGALLLGFLDRSSQILDLEGIPKEIVVIMQGVIVISVVVAYEIVERVIDAREQQRASTITDVGVSESEAVGT